MIRTIERNIIYPQLRSMIYEYKTKEYEMIENILCGILIGMCVYDYLFFG
jgi:hypothetical protein